MGYRTVVIINNDEAGDIQDSRLKRAVETANGGGTVSIWCGPYHVVEQCHADQATLMMVGSLEARTLATGFDFSTSEEEAVLLVRAAADKMGYRLVKKGKA